MDQQTREQLRDLTAQLRAAFADVPEGERYALVDEAFAEVREEMTSEYIVSGELRAAEQSTETQRVRAADSSPLQAV